jgi:hypothetical protein
MTSKVHAASSPTPSFIAGERQPVKTRGDANTIGLSIVSL